MDIKRVDERENDVTQTYWEKKSSPNCFLPFYLCFMNVCVSFSAIVAVLTQVSIRHLNSYRGALNLATATLFGRLYTSSHLN